jgi:hypothetical protein
MLSSTQLHFVRPGIWHDNCKACHWSNPETYVSLFLRDGRSNRYRLCQERKRLGPKRIFIHFSSCQEMKDPENMLFRWEMKGVYLSSWGSAAEEHSLQKPE